MKHYTGKLNTQSLLSSAILNTIIPSLTSKHTSMSAETIYANESQKRYQAFLEEFCVALALGQKDEAYQHAENILQEDASVTKLFLNVFTDSARLLGDKWSDDRYSFGDVTIGLEVLHDMLRHYTKRLSIELIPASTGASVCLSPMPRQDHLFGLFMLEAFLTASKWDVSSNLSNSREVFLNDIATTEYTFIALSVAETGKIDECMELIKNIRNMSLNTDVKVLVGGYPFVENKDLFRKVGADATAENALSALEVMETFCHEDKQLG
jgi:methanogenic corrinoid protein MtbC1